MSRGQLCLITESDAESGGASTGTVAPDTWKTLVFFPKTHS